jgi:hypothetical protein
VVSNFLVKIGESNVISITTLTYTHLDIGTQKLMTDFGVMIVYRGSPNRESSRSVPVVPALTCLAPCLPFPHDFRSNSPGC